MKIVRERINELAGYIDKDPHGDFKRAKDALYEELKKYIKVSLKKTPVEFPKAEDVIQLDEYHGEEESPWKETFGEDYIKPIAKALQIIQEKLQELENVKEVGELNFRSRKKKSFRDRIGL